MPETRKFRVLEMDMEEMNRKIREHRLKIVRRAGMVLGAILLLCLIIYIIGQVMTYDSHETLSSIERADTTATTFLNFGGKILKYGNDGASCSDSSNNLIWSQAYEMTKPIVAMSKKYVAFADEKGSLIYILDQNGLCGQIKTVRPIMRIKIADQGTIAILSEEKGVSYLQICDKSGKNLAEGELHAEKNGYPLDIAISKDGQKLAVSMLDIHGGNVKSVLSFYHFGAAGQKKINNVVGTSEYQDLVIPQIEYIDNDKMAAVSDQKIMLFEGAKKPKEKKTIKFENRLRTFFYNDKYLGLILDNASSAEKDNEVYCLRIYDRGGRLVKEKEFSRTYRKAEFLTNNEVCLLNDNECTIITLRGVEKYHEALDKTIYKILPDGGFSRYKFIMEKETLSVKLKKRRNGK